ncbi:lipase-like PAD4 isoform X2 [Jatropha curcas]|uniref:lipase-like PAD4 isoform X2 n=1 Tax=Jatropha curcas TaxID=180498 RepID=UPI001896074F|nr:lipase-like PAD4 isoform X2 [Jatropha curcas]
MGRFESSEMLASFLASTPLLSESWRLCDLANTTSPHSFVTKQIGTVGYVAFSGIQEPTSCTNLEPLHSDITNDLFCPLQNRNEDEEEEEREETVMVHGSLLQIFLSIHSNQNFRNQMLKIMESSKSIVMTGHSIGGTTASLCALWLLSYCHSTFSSVKVLCITFGSPLLGNESLSRAIMRQRWGGNFCHVVSKLDLVPRLLFAPLDKLTQLHDLLQFWRSSMAFPRLGSPATNLDDQTEGVFQLVLYSLQAVDATKMSCGFWPFGNYLFCSQDGGICIENAKSVIKMMGLLLASGSPSHSIQDHLEYGDYISKVSLQFLKERNLLPPEELPESSYEAGVALALQSSGIPSQEADARDCLKLARRMGRTPNLNCANLAIKLSKITPYRAEIEWYKSSCEQSENQMGYYDSFKQRGASKRDSKVNMNRHKLARFWDNVINMLEKNELPLDFQGRAKWVNAAHSYKLLVEPLDIAEYYRTGMHRENGHYISHGRGRRYRIFDRWWRDRPDKEEEKNKRSRFASLTQDTCFWARVEEARESLDRVRSERDPMNLRCLWAKLDEFERYASRLVQRKEVSKDVVAKNSSYSLWLKDYKELKSQIAQWHAQFPSFLDAEVVP